MIIMALIWIVFPWLLLMLVIAFIMQIFTPIGEVLESFYENNPKYAFYIRWVIAIAIIIIFTVNIVLKVMA